MNQPEYSIEANLHTIIGALFTFRISAEPPVHHTAWNAAVDALGAHESFHDEGGCTPAGNFKHWFQRLADTYRVKDSNADGSAYNARHKLATLPISVVDGKLACTLTIGTVSGAGAKSQPVCTVQLNDASMEWSISTPGADAVGLNPGASDCIETISQCLQHLRPSEVTRVAGHIMRGMQYVHNFTGCLSYKSQYRMIDRLRQLVPTVSIGQSTFFVPHDQAAGDASPIHHLLRLQRVFQTAKPTSHLYTVAMFPSDESRGMVSGAASESLLDKIDAINTRLLDADTMRGTTLAGLMANLDELHAEARMYSRLLCMKVDDIDEAIKHSRSQLSEFIAQRTASV